MDLLSSIYAEIHGSNEMKWERKEAANGKPYWYTNCLDAQSRPLWSATIDQPFEDIYVLKYRIAGYNFDSHCSFHDSVDDAKRAFESYIYNTANRMMKQVGKVRNGRKN